VQSIIIEYNNPNIIFYLEPIPGLHSARQRGIIESKGEILVFIDDDILVDPDWLSSIAQSFTDKSVHLVGGKCLPLYEIEPPKWTKDLWEPIPDGKMCVAFSLIEQGELIKETNPNYVFGVNFSIRKETLLKLGGFHPDTVPKKHQRFQGDGETGLTMKIIKLKLKSIYNPNVKVYHYVSKERMTIRYIQERMFFQGVCDSFTKIRDDYYFSNIHDCNYPYPPLINSKSNFSKNIFSHLNYAYFCRKIKKSYKIFFQIHNRKTVIEKIDLLNKIESAYKEGYDFHQKEVKNDPKLYSWVIKQNYFEYNYFEYL